MVNFLPYFDVKYTFAYPWELDISVFCKLEAIIWTSVELSSVKFCDIHLKTILQWVNKLLLYIMIFKKNHTFRNYYYIYKGPISQ